jgi:hypothetical protein
LGQLAVDPQRLAARRENSQLGASPEQRIGDAGSLADHVLAVIEN